MKRSRIRRKAAVPKKWIDTEARRDYLAAHLRCELEPALAGPKWEKVLASDYRTGLDAHHVHHIGGVRWDIAQNLIAISRRSHDDLHHIEPAADIAVYYAKLNGKTKAARDRIRDVWKRLYGRDIVDWVQVLRDRGTIPEWYSDLPDAILEMF
jgi:hypothetical protein